MLDGLGIGLGFAMALTILGSIREILGSGKFFNMTLYNENYGMLVFVLAPGAFIALGYPVSYTHLDVYKRQLFLCALLGSRLP